MEKMVWDTHRTKQSYDKTYLVVLNNKQPLYGVSLLFLQPSNPYGEGAV